MASRALLKTYFETGDFPTEAQFATLIDSLLHIDEDSSEFGRSVLSAASAVAVKTLLALENVDNTSDANKPLSSAAVAALALKADAADLGTAAFLDVPASGNAASGEVVKGDDTRLTNSRTPTGGAGGVLSGSYPNPGFAVDMATQSELDGHIADTSNPHSVTAAQVGLGNVDNTSDADKPLSTEQAAADAAAVAFAIQRANHTGTQSIATITGLQTALDGKVDENSAITGATKTKITYDAKGLVTAGADATTADIADSADKRYVTDAQLTVIGNTSGTNTGDQTDISGNAATATALETARTINGVSFDGTTNITVAAAAGTLTGTTLAANVTASSLLSAAGGTFGTAAFTDVEDYEVPLTFGDGLTRTGNDIDVDTVQNIAKLSNLTSNGLVKTSGGDGTLSIATANTDYLGVPGGSTEGDILYYNGTTWTRLARGNDGQVLKSTSSSIQWDTDAGGMTNPMTTEGDLIVAGASGTPTRLAVGTDGQVLKVVDGVPAWDTDSTGSGSLPGTPAEGDLVYFDGADWVRLAIGTAGQVLAVNGTADAPEWVAAPAPASAKYIVQEAHSGLSGEQSLGALTTGLLKNTVTGSTGVLSTASAGTDYLDVPGSSAEGDLLYRDSSAWTRLPRGTDGQVLTATASSIEWAAAAGGGGGTLTLARFSALDNQPPTSNYATFDTRNSIAVLDFDAGTAESAVFVGIIPEGADFSTGIAVRIVWMATSATSGDVIWTSAFERGNTDLDADSFATGIDSSAATTNGTSGIPNVTTINHSGAEIDGLAAGDLFRLKITRKAADGADTMSGDAEIIAVEVRQR
jgi:hypothetical protein